MAKGIGFAEQFTPILGIGFAEHSQPVLLKRLFQKGAAQRLPLFHINDLKGTQSGHHLGGRPR